MRYNNSSEVRYTKRWFFSFKVSQIFIVYESAEGIIFGRFLAEWKMHYLAIFLLNSIVTEMPYLPKMNLFLWTTFLSKGFKNGIIQRFWRFLNGDCMAWTQHFTFAGFRKKGNSLGTLIVIFDNVSPKGFFSDWIWRISKFQFCLRILNIYRPLRVRIWSLTGGIESGASQTVGLGYGIEREKTSLILNIIFRSVWPVMRCQEVGVTT